MAPLLTHKVDEAERFLRWLYPAGPWTITSIHPNQTGTVTATFGPEGTGPDDLRQFLTFNQERNIYYSANEVAEGPAWRSKASKLDIARATVVHVDVDPRKGSPIEEEQIRIRDLVLTRLPDELPRPSAIIFSGGGYNLLWRLAAPITIGGNPDAIELVEKRNRGIAALLDGDNCHNIDRILRLPGTINWPSPKKRAAGRVPFPSGIIYLEDTAHPLTSFPVAEPRQAATIGDLPGTARIVNLSGNVRRLTSVDELPTSVPLRTKVMIVQGFDPEDNRHRGDRSRNLFDVCCALARSPGVDDDLIYSVITDPDFGISESVREQKSGMQRYATRQIERAREMAIDPVLHELNGKHAVIENWGGGTLIVEEVRDEAMGGRLHLTKQTFSDFHNRYCNRQVVAGRDGKGREVLQPVGKWWTSHPSRRQYKALTFAPGRDTPGAFNLWRGFAVEPTPGTMHHGYLDHLRDVICGGDVGHYDYLIRWMATAVQHPARPGQVAVVLRGKQGTGKGVMAHEFGALWGRHFLQISDPKHLVGNFNAHLRDCVILFADEAFYAGDKKHASILKSLITEEHLFIEAKRVDAEASNNYVHLIMASNEEWVIPAGRDERRYFVLDVADTRMQDIPHFKALTKIMADGGRSNLLHYLQHLDLAEFDVRTAPRTSALEDQKLLSLAPEQEWWLKKLEDGQVLADAPGKAWQAPFPKRALFDDYYNYVAKLRVYRPLSESVLERWIETIAPGAIYFKNSADGQISIKLLPLAECRASWIKVVGGGSGRAQVAWLRRTIEEIDYTSEPQPWQQTGSPF